MKHGIKMLGLSLMAALSLMALTAAGAQAAGEFRVGGQTFSAAGVTEETITGTLPLGTLLVSNGVTIHCTSGHVLSAKVLKGGKGHAKVEFLGCTVKSNKFCTVYPTEKDLENETNPGLIRAEGTGELTLHGGAHYLTAASESFSTVYLGGEGCTLPEANLVNGSTALALSGALTDSVSQSVGPVNAATEALLKVQLKYGGETATIDGAAGTATLSGVNKGKTWGAL